MEFSKRASTHASASVSRRKQGSLDFRRDRNESHRHDDDWLSIFQAAFPDMVDWRRIRQREKRGDWRVSCADPSRGSVNIEQKRINGMGTIYLETRSQWQDGDGWVYMPGRSDYYAWWDVPGKRVLWLPTAEIRPFWLRHGDELRQRYGERENKRTKGIHGDEWAGAFVPVPQVEFCRRLRADGAEMIIQPMPVPGVGPLAELERLGRAYYGLRKWPAKRAELARHMHRCAGRDSMLVRDLEADDVQTLIDGIRARM